MGIGKAFVLPEAQERVIPKYAVTDDKIPGEQARFKDACTKIYNQIDANLKTKQQNDLQNVIFETYLLMLTDPVFVQEVNDGVAELKQNVESVLAEKTTQYADRLRNSGNDYLAERAQDIEDVFGRVMDVLLDFHEFDIDTVPDGS
ncbi:MAG: phosphoenolpyruvate--protein phosphotransferase, partial [Treponema sp.]|nr:phosphoenolpyruvate--protein phosphotransferase [Treponema sp.]